MLLYVSIDVFLPEPFDWDKILDFDRIVYTFWRSLIPLNAHTNQVAGSMISYWEATYGKQTHFY